MVCWSAAHASHVNASCSPPWNIFSKPCAIFSRRLPVAFPSRSSFRINLSIASEYQQRRPRAERARTSGTNLVLEPHEMTSAGYVTCCSKITLKVDIICLELSGVKSFGAQRSRRRGTIVTPTPEIDPNVFFMENHSSPPPPETLKSHEPARGYQS